MSIVRYGEIIAAFPNTSGSDMFIIDTNKGWRLRVTATPRDGRIAWEDVTSIVEVILSGSSPIMNAPARPSNPFVTSPFPPRRWGDDGSGSGKPMRTLSVGHPNHRDDPERLLWGSDHDKYLDMNPVSRTME